MNRLLPSGRTMAASALLALSALGCHESSTGVRTVNGYIVVRLVADSAGLGATALDTNLRNPWGLAFNATGTMWVSDNRSGKSTLYKADGTILTLVVSIPTASTATGGSPTGIVFNPTSSFIIPSSTKALWIFAGNDGTISAWNATTGNARLVANRSASGATYKGLALAANGGANFLFATNFKSNGVDVFDSTFTFVKTFTDAGMPAGFAPFGIAVIGGQLYVTYARQKAPGDTSDLAGSGNGYVDVFTTGGTLVKRLASNGPLDSPWGVAQAPAGFGTLAGDILVGNFGDGRVSAYDTSGVFMGQLADTSGAPIVLDGLWGLVPGPAAGPPLLFFTAGPDGGRHGLLGTLAP